EEEQMKVPAGRRLALAVAALALALAATGAAAARPSDQGKHTYTAKALVSDQPGTAPTIDANLVNAWSLVAGPTTPWWVADNGRVDMIDGTWHVITPGGAFKDKQIPAGFAPFGIQNIGGILFVTYAKQDANAEDDVKGAGLGFVDAYSTTGKLLARVAQRGDL